ncbi:hypothetical protein Tco_0792967 [Tanacetum coccineum]
MSTSAERLLDIPPKTGDMVTAEIPCRKVLDDKERKKKKAEAKAATNAPDADIQAERDAGKKSVGKEGTSRKKKRVRLETSVQPESEHVSSPIPLNHAHPLETLANKEHVSTYASSSRIDVIRHEPITPHPVVNVKPAVGKDKDQENVDLAFANEGHGDNEDRLSGLCTQPSPVHHLDQRLESARKAAGTWLCLTPKLGLTESCRMDNSRSCRDIMSNLFTPIDNEFFNEGVRNESAIKRSWKLLCQSAQQQANTLLRFEALTEEHGNLIYTHESCKDVKTHYKECKKELTNLQSAFDEKVTAYSHLSKDYDAALGREEGWQERVEELEKEKAETEEGGFVVSVGNGRDGYRRKIINEYLPTFVRLLHHSAEYKWSLGEAFSLTIGKGFIDGISIGRKDSDIQAILTTIPNVDPASSDIFMVTYEKLFDKRYSYVDKVARVYLLDPNGLQNVMPDETSPTIGGGPRYTPTDSYA